MNLNQEHIGELTLRRLRAGEALGPGAMAIQAHATSCPECRARARALDDEQRRFEQEISFDRFAAGVERAARGAEKRQRRRAWLPRLWIAGPLVAMAAAVTLVVTFKPHEQNRTKGGAGMTVRVAGAGGQRDARTEGAERLAPGERLRIGYSGMYAYLLAFSIDDHGELSLLYSERGQSLALPRIKGSPSVTMYLPDSVELTGHGLERIVVVLSDQPIDVAAARKALRAAFDKTGGDLARLPRLGLPGEEFSRTFAKP
jgi:hypothetical protein